jgi:glycosyltransferase involved in cell wall biosynthesis
MRIAVFDYRVVRTNPVGSCHRALLDGLCGEHDFTVFAADFDNPRPGRIGWVRVPVPSRPQALLFVAYHLVAPLCYLLHRLRRGGRHDLVQMVESNLSFGDLSYVHFCHGGFLRGQGVQRSTGRAWLRWLDHRLHATVEPWVFRRVRRIVVPSEELAGELRREYPTTVAKTSVIPNGIDRDALDRPAGFDRQAWRDSLGLHDQDVMVVFTALGHFERKGLPLLLEAVQRLADARFKLVVVGGQPGLVRAYRASAAAMGLDGAVRFVGMQDDVRPFLWAGDLFALPSAYEALPLAALEAAAAGLPLLVSELPGLRDLVADGRSGYVVDRTAAGIAAGLRGFGQLTEERRRAMGRSARAATRPYGLDVFIAGWARLYAALEAERAGRDASRLDEDA